MPKYKGDRAWNWILIIYFSMCLFLVLSISACLVFGMTNIWPDAHNFFNQPSDDTICQVIGKVVIC